MAAREKRSVTGTPVVCLDGSLLTFQIIWKGKTTQCHPRRQATWDGRIFSDNAVKKVQTSLSFGRLLKKVSDNLDEKRRQLELPPGYPAIIIVDNAPSHSGGDFQPAPPPAKPCDHLFATGYPGLWLFTTLKNRSHTLNPGDHLGFFLKCKM